MVKEKKRLEDAFSDVKEARSFVRPSDSFMKQLKQLDEELFGANKKDDIEDAFTKKKRQEIEAEKEMLKGRVKLTEKVKMFADITSPEIGTSVTGSSMNRISSPALGSVRSKWNPESNSDDRRGLANHDFSAPPKKLTSIISLFNKPKEEISSGRNFGPPSNAPVKKWKTVEPPPPPGFCKAVKRNKSRKWQFQNSRDSTESTSSIKKNKSRSNLKRLNSKENSIDSEPKTEDFANKSSSLNKNNSGQSSLVSSSSEKPLLSRQQSNHKEAVVSNGIASTASVAKNIPIKVVSSVLPPPPSMPTCKVSSIAGYELPAEEIHPWRTRKTSNTNDRSTSSAIAYDTVGSPSVSPYSDKTSTNKKNESLWKSTQSKSSETGTPVPPPMPPPVAAPTPNRMVFGKVKPPPMKIIGSGLSTENSRPPADRKSVV